VKMREHAQQMAKVHLSEDAARRAREGGER
jgi:hypothetical protein